MIGIRDASEPSAAERLWLAGEYTLCLQELSAGEPCAARFLLEAKAHYRLRRFEDTLTALDAAAFFCDDAGRAQANALAAVAHACLGDFDASNAALRAIDDVAVARMPRAARCEIVAHRALCAWMRGDFIEADSLLANCDTKALPNVDAQAKFLRSWVRASRGKLREQAALLMDALRTLQAAPFPDAGLMARIVFALATAAREFPLPQELAAVDAALKSRFWTGDLRLEHSQSLRHCAWAHALQANYIPAIRQLRGALDVAPSPYFEVLSRFDRAAVSRIAGERSSCEAEALDAADLALSLDWSVTRGEELVALLVGAEILAGIDVRIAQDLLQRFELARPNMSHGLVHRRDPRLTALAKVAQASIAGALHDTNAVRRSAKAAFEIYDDLGLTWRAASCALLMYRSGCGDDWLRVAKRQLGPAYARSFIAAEIERVERQRPRATNGDLTARQREIFALLMEGMSIDDIAQRLICSRNTVRIHVGAVYRKFGVRNRVELLTQATA